MSLRVLAAVDKFKGTATAEEVGRAAAAGLARAFRDRNVPFSHRLVHRKPPVSSDVGARERTSDTIASGSSVATAVTITDAGDDLLLETRILGVADGGDGFLDAMCVPLRLERVSFKVNGPLGVETEAVFGISAACAHESRRNLLDARLPELADTATLLSSKTRATENFNLPRPAEQEAEECVAVIEMARTSGLAQVPENQRDPRKTTSVGTGQLLGEAYRKGARTIVLGVGGSATNDCGLGCLAALGLRVFLDDGSEYTASGEDGFLVGADMARVSRLELPEGGLLPGASLEIACDVDSPLVGPLGATSVFGPQKGATDPEVQTALEEGMSNVALRLKEDLPNGFDVREMPGAGAAGGIAGGLIAALGRERCKLRPGFDIVADSFAPPLTEQIRDWADIVITGEGAIDASTASGKVPSQVVKICRRFDKPVFAICGINKLENQGEAEKSGDATKWYHNVPIFDLVSEFGQEKAMQQPQECIEELVFRRADDALS